MSLIGPKFILPLALALAGDASAQTTINTTNRFSYASNVGWINWHGDTANGAVIGEYVCSGYIYAANVGWIHLGDGTPANGIQYLNNSATDFGINHDSLGNLRGYAWGANIGWISFENTGAPRFDLFTGRFSGHIWAANVGWISLSNSIAHVQTDSMRPGLDTDNDGIADAFELTHSGNLTGMNGLTDTDGDGSSDLAEYLAGTHPLNTNSLLRITYYVSNPSNTVYSLAWNSEVTRGYKLQTRLTLNTNTPWVDHTNGFIMPDPGATTARTFNDTPATQRYFQVKALQPLP